MLLIHFVMYYLVVPWDAFQRFVHVIVRLPYLVSTKFTSNNGFYFSIRYVWCDVSIYAKKICWKTATKKIRLKFAVYVRCNDALQQWIASSRINISHHNIMKFNQQTERYHIPWQCCASSRVHCIFRMIRSQFEQHSLGSNLSVPVHRDESLPSTRPASKLI